MVVDWLANTLRPHPFRGKLRILDPLTPREGRRSAAIFDFRMELDLADRIQRDIYLGTYEPRETGLVRNLLKPGMTFVDAGANVGYYTALAASCVGASGCVVSFEPQPKVFAQLTSMIERNGLTQVQAFCCGLSSEPGDLPLYLPPESVVDHNATMVPHGAETQVLVPVNTLDVSIEKLGIEWIDLLKVDVEGYEPQVFHGAARLLSERRISAVMCEFNDFWLKHAGGSAQELYRTLREAGFREAPGQPAIESGCMETLLLCLA